MENFSETQQQLIQSLIREKPIVCTFRVGSRPYGIKTYQTLGGEINHEGEEFELISLDEIKAEAMISKHMLDTDKILNDYNKFNHIWITICE